MFVPAVAEAAGLGLSTIVDFEKSRRDVSRTAVHAMQKALEKVGIQFIAKNGGGPERPAPKVINTALGSLYRPTISKLQYL